MRTGKEGDLSLSSGLMVMVLPVNSFTVPRRIFLETRGWPGFTLVSVREEESINFPLAPLRRTGIYSF